VTGRSMSAIGVSQEPTLLTIGEATIGSRASWNGVLAYALRWSPSGYPVALAARPIVSAAGGYPGHVVIHRVEAIRRVHGVVDLILTSPSADGY
jgi:hypothetical protein